MLEPRHPGSSGAVVAPGGPRILEATTNLDAAVDLSRKASKRAQPEPEDAEESEDDAPLDLKVR